MVVGTSRGFFLFFFFFDPCWLISAQARRSSSTNDTWSRSAIRKACLFFRVWGLGCEGFLFVGCLSRARLDDWM